MQILGRLIAAWHRRRQGECYTTHGRVFGTSVIGYLLTGSGLNIELHSAEQ
jgi:hypothetical protein